MGLNKGQKLLRMVEMMEASGGVTADELRDVLDLDSRGLRRYLADLRELEIPFVSHGRGLTRTFTLAPHYRRRGVRLSLAEVLSLHFGRTLFTFLDGTSFADDLDGAIERLKPAISKEHAEISADLDSTFLAVAMHRKDYTGDLSEVIDDLVTALVYSNPLELDYRRADGTAKHYSVHPFTLAIYHHALYLFAYDRDDARVKTFAVERIKDVRRNRRRTFSRPKDWDPNRYLQNAFGIISGKPHRVLLRFAPHVALYVRERHWHPTQQIREEIGGGLVLEMDVAVTAELRNWVLGFGAGVEVIAPTALRNEVRDEMLEALNAYR